MNTEKVLERQRLVGDESAPEEIHFGEHFELESDNDTTTSIGRYSFYLERNHPHIPDAYRAEVMGITCEDGSFDRNDDGSWGDGHHADAIAAAMATVRAVDGSYLRVEVVG